MKEQMYDDLVNGILSFLSEQTLRIVLYGSEARGTATPESDIDIAVFINGRLTPQQRDLLSDLIVDLDLKYDRVFSVVDIDQQTYMAWRAVMPFYQSVDREGVVLWKVAA